MSNSPPNQLNKPIILVGLMGCGKSTIGRRLATHLHLPFIDLDNEIEALAGMSISEIFDTFGEAHFRALELEAFNKLINGNSLVMATGGGAFINGEIRALVKSKGISVWIKADLETLLERVSRKNNRPLLANGYKPEILQHLMDKRYPIYAEADITVNTNRGTHDVVMYRIIESLNAMPHLHSGEG
jgi:shikimate kinase